MFISREVLTRVVHFYNAHSGEPFTGSAMRLPKVIKQALNQIENQEMTLWDALKIITEALQEQGELEIKKDKYSKNSNAELINLWAPYKTAFEDGYPVHLFTLIRFKPVTPK